MPGRWSRPDFCRISMRRCARARATKRSWCIAIRQSNWPAKAAYNKILLDPIMIWRGKDSKVDGLDPKEAQVIAGSFYALLYQELAKDYEMVSEPGPKMFRMQAAHRCRTILSSLGYRLECAGAV